MNNLIFPKLVKDNRFWEIVISNDQNNISIYTKYGIISKGQSLVTGAVGSVVGKLF